MFKKFQIFIKKNSCCFTKKSKTRSFSQCRMKGWLKPIFMKKLIIPRRRDKRLLIHTKFIEFYLAFHAEGKKKELEAGPAAPVGFPVSAATLGWAASDGPWSDPASVSWPLGLPRQRRSQLFQRSHSLPHWRQRARYGHFGSFITTNSDLELKHSKDPEVKGVHLTALVGAETFSF